MPAKLEFGLFVSNHNNPKKIIEFVQTAEDSNFDYFLISDHYLYHDEPDCLEAWALISFLAGMTSRIKLGTCVTPLTLRHPAQLAKFISSLDVCSSGRIVVGVGAGWYEEEYRMFSQWNPDKERVQQFQEALQIMLAAWTKKASPSMASSMT